MLSSVSTSTGRASAWPAPAGGPQFVAIDSNGNLTSKVEDGHSWSYEWNAQDQLKRVLKDAVEVARYAYDPKGRRVEKVASGVTTTYAYDNEDILKQVTGGAVLRYVHGPDFDEAMAAENGIGQLAYEHADGLGSELKTTDSTGAGTFSRSYDAFGQALAGASTSGYAFTGREWEPETGIYYYRSRYYDPKVGRFISQDPLWLLVDLNGYRYVNGNPATLVDPLGLASMGVGQAQQIIHQNNNSGQSDELILCLVWKESNFDPTAKATGSSATGLTMMTTGAAQEVGACHCDMQDPEKNVSAGTKYLRVVIKRARGNVKRGLNRYGTGSGYANNILECEQCLMKSQTVDPFDCRRNPYYCLKQVHP